MFGAHKDRIRHLDYGGGTGQLSQALAGVGGTSRSYDRFYDRAAPPSAGEPFDLITAFEVFEHAVDVHGLMREISALSHSSTFVVFTTLTHDTHIRRGERINWWYVAPRNGHVSVFSKASLVLLAEQHGWRFGSFNDNQHFLCRMIPDWVAPLIRA